LLVSLPFRITHQIASGQVVELSICATVPTKYMYLDKRIARGFLAQGAKSSREHREGQLFRLGGAHALSLPQCPITFANAATRERNLKSVSALFEPLEIGSSGFNRQCTRRIYANRAHRADFAKVCDKKRYACSVLWVTNFSVCCFNRKCEKWVEARITHTLTHSSPQEREKRVWQC
jgi:hypothetical protein